LGEVSNAHKILARKVEGKGPLGGPRHRWEDGIKMYLEEILINSHMRIWTQFIWHK
jgi:hypothetical protein